MTFINDCGEFVQCKKNLAILLQCIYIASNTGPVMTLARLIKGIWVMMNGIEEFQKASKESMTKAMESYGALSRACRRLQPSQLTFPKSHSEEGAAHLETLMGAKSFDVALEAQTDFVKASYEGAVSQATKIGELYADLAKDTMKPFEGFLPKAGK